MKKTDLIPHASKFLQQFVLLLSGPKNFVKSLNLREEKTFYEALHFFSFAVAVTVLTEGLFISSQRSFSDIVIKTTFFHLIGTFIIALVIFCSWRVVKGKGSLKNHLILAWYFNGVGLIIWSLSAFISKGYMKINAPAHFELLVEYVNLLLANSNEISSNKFAPIAESQELFIAIALFTLGIFLYFIWIFLCWGGYRSLNEKSRGKSFVVFVLFLLFCFPVSYAFDMLQHAINIPLF